MIAKNVEEIIQNINDGLPKHLQNREKGGQSL